MVVELIMTMMMKVMTIMKIEIIKAIVLLQRHMDDSGIDGARVEEQLRRLPRSNVHVRNDFFDLGITAPTQAAAVDGLAGQEQLDNMSVISATAAVALPQAYTQVG